MLFNQTTRDCGTVTVEESTPDRSELSINLDALNSPEPNTIVADYTVSNNVTSGNGETLTADFRLTVDGSEVASESHPVGANSTRKGSFNVSGVSPGDHEVCLELV